MRPDSHEIYTRRRSHNVWLGVILGAFVVTILAVTMVKISNGALMEGYDHQPRASLTGERTE
jgi:hypothetical protein